MERRNAWKVYDQTELEKLDKINETYKNCLDDGKTERECITPVSYTHLVADLHATVIEIVHNPSCLHKLLPVLFFHKVTSS